MLGLGGYGIVAGVWLDWFGAGWFCVRCLQVLCLLGLFGLWAWQCVGVWWFLL